MYLNMEEIKKALNGKDSDKVAHEILGELADVTKKVKEENEREALVSEAKADAIKAVAYYIANLVNDVDNLEEYEKEVTDSFEILDRYFKKDTKNSNKYFRLFF